MATKMCEVCGMRPATAPLASLEAVGIIWRWIDMQVGGY
jgi:hypothetical protein